MKTIDSGLACRMIKACATAYYIGQPGGITASPFYGDLGFETEPKVFQAGPDGVDACMVGANADGVVLAFRGTIPLNFSNPEAFFRSLLDWLNDAEFSQVEVEGIPGKVHRGFADALASLWELFLPEVRRLAGAGGKPLVITGHSKGASVATLAAVRLLNREGIKPGSVYTFASARTGDPTFAENYDAKLPQTWRFANRDDLVPHLPPNDKLIEVLEKLPDSEFKDLRKLPAYEHVKTLKFIDWEGQIEDESFWLELERLAHLARMLAEFKIKEIAEDHSSSGGYMADTCRTAGQS